MPMQPSVIILTVTNGGLQNLFWGVIYKIYINFKKIKEDLKKKLKVIFKIYIKFLIHPQKGFYQVPAQTDTQD